MSNSGLASVDPERVGLVSVILIARNEERFIGDQLTALSEQQYTGRWELLVVDNGSTDATRARVIEFAERFPRLRLIDAPDKPGAGYARNRGAQAAEGDYLLFVDADDRVAPGWLEAMAHAARTWDTIAGGLALSRVGTDGTWTASAPLDQLPTHGYNFLPSIEGANFGIAREVFLECGGFHEVYDRTRAGEDVDFCWRLQLSGHTLRFVPEGLVFFRERSSLKELWKQAHRDGGSGPRLFRDFRSAGMPRSSTSEALRWWASVWRRLLRDTRAIDSRRDLIREVGWRTGRVAGSIKARVLYL